MEKFFKNRTAIGITSIILALIISFGVTPLLNNAMKKQTEVVRASKNIRKGEKITKDKIIKVKVGAYNLPQDIIKDPDKLIGSYANTDIYKDDYFLSTKISNVKGKDDPYLYEIGDRMAVSITVKNFAAGLSGKLKSGDIVSLISSNEDGASIIPELQYVEILALTVKSGSDMEEKPDSEKEEEFYATATLLVSPKQAEKLVEYEQNGDIHIGLVYRGDQEIASQYIEIQDKYIEEMELKVEGSDLEEEGNVVDGEGEA
ncbi:Flp pilus assembly protein CpaB [Xylanivirga thermophila]|uniref:Flp pilus assembly protein CpaB n=1 Tax=Xylanivirga thermophila TaxID=2496273 RepID=UPI00101DA3EA|nr:RcpC/CpaB family pilus assembly protein [Xylanivirga thermophila]